MTPTNLSSDHLVYMLRDQQAENFQLSQGLQVGVLHTINGNCSNSHLSVHPFDQLALPAICPLVFPSRAGPALHFQDLLVLHLTTAAWLGLIPRLGSYLWLYDLTLQQCLSGPLLGKVVWLLHKTLLACLSASCFQVSGLFALFEVYCSLLNPLYPTYIHICR